MKIRKNRKKLFNEAIKLRNFGNNDNFSTKINKTQKIH